MTHSKALVFIPTYNERENVEKIYDKVSELGLGLDILFLDDNSPDGTGAVLDAMASRHPRIKIIHRREKSGVGSAHQEGIRWAYEHGYTTLVTMDCDFTHPPRYIPEFLEASRDHAVVVGSRWLHRNSLSSWNLYRLALTCLGHLLTKYLLHMPYDATGAYRLYRLDRIRRHVFSLVHSKGYSFFFESLYILNYNRFPIKEVPITLPARTYGHSKMKARDAMHSVGYLVHLCATQWINPRRLRALEPFATEAAGLESDKEWDDYWSRKRDASGMVFDAIAAFYRRFIIKRTLNHFIRKYFKPGSEILHAGCGSGEVDADIARVMRITALDISLRALDAYKSVNGNHSRLMHGSIFKIPIETGSMDGVYNLGVMEHFPEDQVVRICSEFHRVLRRDGKMVLFWPPEFGFSVLALRFAHFVLNRVLGNDVKLHPDEITRVRSRRHVRALLEKANFRLVQYYFGPKDFFTHAVVVASKN